MNLRLAGPLSSFLLLLAGCGAPENNSLPPNALRVEVGDVAWAAYQDGDGLWQRLPEGRVVNTVSAAPLGTHPIDHTRMALLEAGHTRSMPRGLPSEVAMRQLEPLQTKEVILNITDAQGRYGLAYVCLEDDLSDDDSDLAIRLSTLATDSDKTISCYNDAEEASHTLSGTVGGIGANELGVVYAGWEQALVDAASTAYTFDLRRDLYDVIATRYSGNATAPNRIILQNEVSLEANRTLELDFEGASAFTPETYTATITDVTKGLSPSGGVTMKSKNYTLASLGGVTEGTAFDYAFIPPETAGDESEIYAHASGSNDAGAGVSVSRYLLTPADVTLSLPEPLSGINISAVQGPTRYRFPTATWNAYSGERVRYDLHYFQLPDTGSSPGAAVYLDKDWLAPNTTFKYTLPDLSAVTDWNSAWNLRAGEGIYWYIGASLERSTTAESPDYIYVEQSGTVP